MLFSNVWIKRPRPRSNTCPLTTTEPTSGASSTSYSFNTEASLRSGTAFSSYQQRRRRNLWACLGELPWHHQPGPATLLNREECEGYTLERLILDLNGLEPVPAILVIPHKRQTPAP